MKRLLSRYSGLLLLFTIVLLCLTASRAASSSSVRELRIQKVGDLTYFHLRLDLPPGLVQDLDRLDRGFFGEPSPSLAPRLVGPADQVRLVCQRFDPNRSRRFGEPGTRFSEKDRPFDDKDRFDKDGPPGKGRPVGPRQPAAVEGLEFVGRTSATGEVKLKLLYPIQGRRPRIIGRLSRTPPAPVWKEMEVVLDFARAKTVPVPAEAAERKEKRAAGRDEFRPPVRDDLEGLWAVAQVDQFADLDNEVREFGFYGFAASAAARKYGVRGPNATSSRMQARFGGPGGRFRNDQDTRELYETTTGAAAITESLQLRRMNPVGGPAREDEKRTIPIGKIRGIDIAEHPWVKMMGEKKPAPEPFARLIPHDNYYVHFKRIARFNEFAALLDQWGTNVTRAYEVTSRDHRLKQRYEQQLCLRSTFLGKTLGPLVIKGVAITGNDAYLREGTDLALVFEVVNKKIFLSAVEPFLTEARKKFGDALNESKSEHHGVTIESFVTPRREVSLHRASIDSFVVYANSPVGIRRILDTYQGRGKRLSDSLDFQYMRTVFRYDDRAEDGFAFLSDAFIRNLVGPACKIKERRRLEALVSLHVLTHGAMYTAWETGKPPTSGPDIFGNTGLTREELPMPEGKPATWDAKEQVAHSDVYNTIHFATPLIELPMEQVTRTEAQEYDRFRQEYLGLWRQFFDPIGMRVSLREEKVQLDTYILPLIENTSYNELRRITGQKSVRFDPSAVGDRTLVQYVLRLSTNIEDRNGWFGMGLGRRRPGDFHPLAMLAWAMDPVGEWFLLRLDDSPVYEKLLALAEKAEGGRNVDIEEMARTVWSLPVAIGVDVRNPLVFAGTLATLRTSVKASLPGALTWEPLEKEYRGVSIVRVGATAAGRRLLGPIGPGDRPEKKDAFLPAIYYAMIDGGFYLTLNEEMMRGLIDAATAKRDGKQTIEAASSLLLAPRAAVRTRDLLRRYLEHQTHQQARTALPIWYALYRTGIVAVDASAEEAQKAAHRYLGYVPVSPDGTGFRFDRGHDEVTNERHGSFRKPTMKKVTAETSPLNFLYEELASVRADLRFREDGIHTVLTIDRVKSKK